MDVVSYRFMEDFRNKHVVGGSKKVCDVGSSDVNGTYRPLFTDHQYVGIDIIPGKNVDIVVPPYKYPFRDGEFDVVISGQTLEHVEDIFGWIKEVARISNDLVCVIAPWRFKEHRHPVDCWRILPDGMKYLFNISGLEIINVRASGPYTIGIGRQNYL